MGQYLLGLMHKRGSGVEKDTKKALQWLEKSSSQGLSSALFVLSKMYRQGDWVTKNEEKAKDLAMQSISAPNRQLYARVTSLLIYQ